MPPKHLATDPAAVNHKRRPLAAGAALGMALFIFTESMMFAGFLSAFIIVRSNAAPGTWPPPGQPRLPAEQTLVNTLILLLSGAALVLAGRAFRKGRLPQARLGMGIAVLLGAFFVLAQGREWVTLLGQGLTLTSSQLGSFFYVIVGAHALHAMAAIVLLGLAWGSLGSGRLTGSRFAAVEMFWYFVVLVWPFLYWQVYL